MPSAANDADAAPPARSPFSPMVLAQWRTQLALRRRGMTDDISQLREDAMPTETVTVSSNHLADGASDAQDQDLSAIAADSEHELVWQIDRAIRKIDTGLPLPFGICEHTREPIAQERLELMPWTPLSTAGAAYLESKYLALDDLLVDG